MAVKVKISKVNGGVQAFKAVQKENIKNAKRAMGDAILGRATIWRWSSTVCTAAAL